MFKIKEIDKVARGPTWPNEPPSILLITTANSPKKDSTLFSPEVLVISSHWPYSARE
jgi:hypothetical protein